MLWNVNTKCPVLKSSFHKNEIIVKVQSTSSNTDFMISKLLIKTVTSVVESRIFKGILIKIHRDQLHPELVLRVSVIKMYCSLLLWAFYQIVCSVSAVNSCHFFRNLKSGNSLFWICYFYFTSIVSCFAKLRDLFADLCKHISPLYTFPCLKSHWIQKHLGLPLRLLSEIISGKT